MTDINQKYEALIDKKVKKAEKTGFKIKESELSDVLEDFQKYVVSKALEHGKFGLFGDTGTGKTLMQLEWAKKVNKHTGGTVLIVAPLAVAGQTKNEAEKINIKVHDFGTGLPIQITNYENLHNVSPEYFTGVVLDESSILKSFTGKTKKQIIEKFKNTPYKLACTATPSPNDLNELGNHSEFLDVLDAPDMRSRWFVRDEGMNNYRLKNHAHDDFYSWISSWAVMFSNPADLGFNGDKFELPELQYHENKIITPKQDNGKLFNDKAVNATNFNQELRRTIHERIETAVGITKQYPDDYIIIWINQNAEADLAVQRLKAENISHAEVRGNEKPEQKEQKLLGFARKEFRVLVTKKKIAQFGLNYQHANRQVFAAMDFSFEGLYQAIRRSYRYGQKQNVHIHLISTDTMENVVEQIKAKQIEFERLQRGLRKQMQAKEYKLVKDYTKDETKTDEYHIIKGDAVKEIDYFNDNSLDMAIFSPPFSALFTYTNNYRDMGNSSDHNEFFEQYQYLLDKLYNKMRPGRLVAVHTKDLAVYKNSSGYTGLYDFTGDNHKAMENAGFKYHSKITIWTDPVLEMQRTKTQRLLYKQLKKDSSLTGVGLPEYLTLFRKWDSENEHLEKPVQNKNEDVFPLDTWQKWASPVWSVEPSDVQELEEMLKHFKTQAWFDIRRTDVLNSKEGTDTKDEKHIAPLQLSVIRRAVQMWTNPGETVFSPFAGIGSEGYGAMQVGRKFAGIELKDSYYETAIKNLERLKEKNRQKAMF